MKQKISYICVLMVLVLSFFSLTFAYEGSEEALKQINNSFSANFNLMHFNYIEFPEAGDAPGPIEIYGNAFGVAFDFRNVFLHKLYTDLTLETAVVILQPFCRH